jgi:hypothetical protein
MRQPHNIALENRALAPGRRPTKRAPDVWESPRFQAFLLALSWFRQTSVISSRPAAGNANRWALTAP